MNPCIPSNTSDVSPATLDSLAVPIHLPPPDDADLLEIYIATGKQDAINQLIHRYSPLVFGVARRLLVHSADVDDAIQATFLIFIRSAKSIRKQQSLGAWLYGVAYRTSIRIRQRRKNHPALSFEDQAYARDHENPLSRLARELDLECLDQELQKLPDRVRIPVIEHYLFGLTAPQIAERMAIHVSAVEGRLKRGRKLLRQRLARRGISLAVAFGGALGFQQQVHASQITLNSSQEGFLDASSPAPLDPHLQSLVHEEMTMKWSMLFHGSASLGVFLAVAATIGMGAMAIPGHGFGETGAVLTANEAITEAPFELAQGLPTNRGGSDSNRQATSTTTAGNPNAPTTASTNPVASPLRPGLLGGGSETDPLAASTNFPLQKPADAEPKWLMQGRTNLAIAENIRNQLDRETVTTKDMVNVPLGDVLNTWSAQLQFPIVINRKSVLENSGLDIDQEIVQVRIPEMNMRSALSFLLKQHKLDYRITQDYIEVVASDDALQVIRYYDLAYVINRTDLIPSIVQAIESTIYTDQWVSQGGMSSISVVGSMMIVNASEDCHHQIERLLVEIQSSALPTKTQLHRLGRNDHPE